MTFALCVLKTSHINVFPFPVCVRQSNKRTVSLLIRIPQNICNRSFSVGHTKRSCLELFISFSIFDNSLVVFFLVRLLGIVGHKFSATLGANNLSPLSLPPTYLPTCTTYRPTSFLPTYLLPPSYLPNYMYLPTYLLRA